MSESGQLWYLLFLLIPLIPLIIYCLNRPRDRGGWKISGKAEVGFEEVMQHFQKYYKQGHDKNSQLAVYCNDKLVVNLTGNTDPNFNENSLVPIYSSGKSLAAIILAFMRD